MHTNGKHSSAEQPAVRGRLAAARRVAVLPFRTPAAAWQAVTGVIGDALTGAGFERAEAVRAACRRLVPVARHLLTMHFLECGRVEFACAEDLLLDFTFAYGGTEPDEDLTVPPVEVLGPLGATVVPALTFYSTCPLEGPFLGALLDAVNREGVLEARVAVLDAGRAAGKEAGAALPDLLDHPGPCIVTDPKGENHPFADEPPEAREEENHDRHD